MVGTVIAIFAPGQGAQTPGMLAPWLELPGVAEQLAEFSEVTGLDLARLGTTADADEIKDTAVTQPLIVALGRRSSPAGSASTSDTERVVAGHSVGELTAAAVSGALSPVEAVAFAARRGAEMAAACALTPTGMSALLGGDPDEVAAGIEAAGPDPGQPQRRGADRRRRRRSTRWRSWPPNRRPVPACARSPVAGAFHTHYMAPAEARAARVRRRPAPSPTRARSCCPTPTAPRSSPAPDLVARLVRQVTLPGALGPLPAHLRRPRRHRRDRARPGRHAHRHRQARAARRRTASPIKTPDDLDRARALDRQPARSTARASTPSTSASSSRRPRASSPAPRASTRAARSPAAPAWARSRTNRDEHEIVAPQAGVLAEWLRNDGDIVAAGLPVARIHNGAGRLMATLNAADGAAGTPHPRARPLPARRTSSPTST